MEMLGSCCSQHAKLPLGHNKFLSSPFFGMALDDVAPGKRAIGVQLGKNNQVTKFCTLSDRPLMNSTLADVAKELKVNQYIPRPISCHREFFDLYIYHANLPHHHDLSSWGFKFSTSIVGRHDSVIACGSLRCLLLSHSEETIISLS